MRYGIKIAGYVAFNHPLVAFPAMASESVPNKGDGVIGVAVGPESIRVFAEVRFPYRFEDHAKSFLYNAVKQGWNA
jgi:hypothetical protein